MDTREQISEANALHIREEINALKIKHLHHGKTDYSAFWTHSKQVSELFKTLKPLIYEDRERLWAQFCEICDSVKIIQKQEKEELAEISTRKSKMILNRIDEAQILLKGVKSSAGISNAQTILNECMKWIKCDTTGVNESSGQFRIISAKLTFDDNNICWANWKDSHDLLQNRKNELSDTNHHEYFDRAIKSLKTAREEDPYTAKEMIREIQNDLKITIMSSAQFQEIRDVLDQAWKIAVLRQDEKKKESAIKGLDNLERWETTLIKNEEVIERLNSQIEECRIMEKDATSYEFASKVRGWIEEKIEKINSIRNSSIEIQQKINSAKIKAMETGTISDSFVSTNPLEPTN